MLTVNWFLQLHLLNYPLDLRLHCGIGLVVFGYIRQLAHHTEIELDFGFGAGGTDGSKITVRPSGTEPKIKFYFGVVGELPDVAQYDEANAALQAKIKGIIEEMKL